VQLLNDIFSLDDFSEDSVFSVQPGAGHESYEELTSVGVLSSISHRQQKWFIVFQSEILIIKFVSIN